VIGEGVTGSIVVFDRIGTLIWPKNGSRT
jgi:hypothetical protein